MSGPQGKNKWGGIISRLGQIPGDLLQMLKVKADTLIYSAKQAKTAQSLPLSSIAILRLEASLKSQLYAPAASAASLIHGDEILLERILTQTDRDNRNNVTRTQAYWELYSELPELHWALLAHMVSRNGGWTMTDLKGDLLPRLLSCRQTEDLFLFLERANGLIFRDAFPQLLLYKESKRIGRPLFHLLPRFSVSRWMEPVWNQFWDTKDSVLLTVSLIINEQNYIEKRIIQNLVYKKSVLDTLMFKAQSLLQLNQVVFPFQQERLNSRLAGLILEDFSDLDERIEFGKKLYAILFGLPDVHRGVLQFARRTPHTGSRADYRPDLFACIRKAPHETKFQERLDGCKLNNGAEPFYSPRLAQAWKDRRMDAIEPGDWFHNLKVLQHVRPIPVPFLFEMTGEYCLGLNKIELAILAGETLR